MHELVYDLPTLIEAGAIVLPRQPGTELTIAGDGSLRGDLERHAAARLPAGRFRFLGRQSPETLAQWLASTSFGGASNPESRYPHRTSFNSWRTR